jgi:hypothetical protein
MSINSLIDSISNAENRYVIEQDVLAEYRDLRKKCSSSFNVGEEGTRLLESQGIPVDPLGKNVHAHPISATIENHVLGLIFQKIGDEPVALYSLKDRKVPARIKHANYVNFVGEPKDTDRYDSGNCTRWSPTDCAVGFCHENLNESDLSDAVKIFEDNPNLQRLYVTLNFPPEIILGTEPVYRKVYTFSRHAEYFDFFPDGDITAAYRQSYKAREFLEHCEINRGNTHLTITVLFNFFSHYGLLITRGQVPLRENRAFGFKEHELVTKHWATYPANRSAIPTVVLDKLQKTILRTTSFSLTQLRNKCLTIQQENKCPLSVEDTILATDYCMAHTIGFRESLQCFYPINKWHHTLTRNLLAASVRLALSSPAQIATHLGLHRLRKQPGYTVIETKRAYLDSSHSEGIAHRPRPRRQRLRELAQGIRSALVGHKPVERPSHPYVRPVLLCLAIHWFLRGYVPALPFPPLPPLLPILRNLQWLTLFSPLLLALCSYSVHCVYVCVDVWAHAVSDYIDYLLSFSGTLSVVHTNLITTLSGTVNHSATQNRQTPKRQGKIKNEGGKLTFKFGDFTSLSKVQRPHSEAILAWLLSYDPGKFLTYVTARGSTVEYPNRLSLPFALLEAESLLGLPLVCVGDPQEFAPHDVHKLALESNCARITCFPKDKKDFAPIAAALREDGFDVHVNCEGFPGYSAAITFTNRSVQPSGRKTGWLRSANEQGVLGPTTPTANEEPDRNVQSARPVHNPEPSPLLEARHPTGPTVTNERGSFKRSAPSPPPSSAYTDSPPTPPKSPVIVPASLLKPEGTNEQGAGPNVSGCNGLIEQKHNNDCYISALATSLCRPYEEIKTELVSASNNIAHRLSKDLPVSLRSLGNACATLGYCLEVHNGPQVSLYGASPTSNKATAFIDLNENESHVTACRCSVSPITGMPAGQTKFKLNRQRMEDYVRLVIVENFGTVLTRPEYKQVQKQMKAEVDAFQPKELTCSLILGQPGSGKSSGFLHRFIRWLHSNRDSKWIFAFQSSDVRDKVKAKIQREHPCLRNFGGFMPTREYAMTCSSNVDVLCIDELGRWYPGEAELLILRLKPRVIILNGDPLQGRFPRAMVAKSAVGDNPTLLDVLLPDAQTYLQESHRLSANWSPVYGFPCHGPDAPMYRQLDYIRPGSTVLASNHDTVRALNDSGYKSMSFGTSQGWDSEDRYVVLINHESLLTDENQWYSAITRGKKGFDVYIVDKLRGPNCALKARPGSICRALMTQGPTSFSMLRAALVTHRASSLPSTLTDPLAMAAEQLVGKKKADDLAADYDFHGDYSGHELHPLLARFTHLIKSAPDYRYLELPEYMAPLEYAEMPAEPGPEPEEQPTCLDPTNAFESLDQDALEDLVINLLGPNSTKESREHDFHGTLTDQVDDENETTGLYLRHSSKDETLIKWAIEKRVKWRTRPPKEELRLASEGSCLLIGAFEKLVGPGLVPFDEVFYQNRVLRSFSNLLDKDVSLNKSKQHKCDPLTPENWTQLLIKQQIIKKIGKINSNAKAGQILTEHVHRVATEMAAMFMYILYKTQELVKKHNIYLHPGHSDSQFREFIEEHWDPNQMSTEDDATAWDGNFGAEFIGWEYYLLDKFQMPHDLKERFKTYKECMRCVAGPIAFMMFSGGPDTLPINTLGQMTLQELRFAVSAMKFAQKMNGGKPIPQLFSGDDFAANTDCKFTDLWTRKHKLFKQEFKPIRTTRPHAFGWRIGRSTCKDPTTVLARAIYNEAKGKGSVTTRDLLCDTETLLTDSNYSDFTEEEQIITNTASSLVKAMARKYHIPLAGNNQAKKRGDHRTYDLTKLEVFSNL